MAIIPQYRAQGPAGPQAPVMEQQSGPRVDASEAVRGVAALAGVVQGVQVGQLDPNLGQQSAQGLQAISAGVGDVGGALFDISQRVAEAKNYADEHEAQIAMDREVGEFEKWRIQNPDPTGWEPAWRERMDRFGGQYFSGKNLAPVAQEAIKQRLGSFTERRAIQVGVDAMRESVGRATSALSAEYMRAVEAGDADTAQAIADDGFKRGWIPEDQAERMKIQARDQVETKQIDELKNYVEADINEGRYSTAKERIRMAGIVPEDEAAAWISGIEKQERQTGLIEEVNQVGYVNPSEGIRLLNEVDENGEWKNYKGMSEEARFKKSREFSGYQAEKWEADAAALASRIGKEGLTEEEIMQEEGFKSLPAYLQDITLARSRKGALDDFMELSDFKTKAQSNDTRSEEGKIKAKELAAEASLRFSGDSLKSAMETLQSTLDNPKPLMPDAEAITMARASIRDRFENEEFGRFKYAKSEIIEQEVSVNGEKTGEMGYFVADPDPPTGFGYRERHKTLFGESFDGKYRRIQLSPEQVKQFKTAKDDTRFVDQVFYQAAGRKFIDAVETVERKKDAGEYDSAVDYQSELGSIMGISKQEAFERREYMGPAESEFQGMDSPSGSAPPEGVLMGNEEMSRFIQNYQIPF